MRTIRVTGKGSLKLHPDLTRITVTMTELHKDYAETLERSAEDTEALAVLLGSFGFARAELKTLSFSIDAEYESYRENEEYKQRFAGYRYRHTLKVEFDSDNERLGKILYALANCDLHPEFNIAYTVKDREAAKNELLAKAVCDAKNKAAVLAGAAGLELGDIQTVDYSWGEIDMVARPVNRLMAAGKTAARESAGDGYSMDLEPDDIEASDTVTVVWEIG